MPPVVLFDFHETLVQLTPSTDATLAQIVGVPEERCRAIFSSVEGQLEELRAAGQWPPPGAERWTRLYQLILDVLELPGDGADVARQMGERFMDPSAYELFPEVPAMLTGLADEGVRVGILSNTDLRLQPLLEGLGLDGFVETAVAAYRHGVEKPEPAAFRLALDALGAHAETTWFVGDSLHHDVLPAADVGMSPVLIDRLAVHPPSDAYTSLPSLASLPELVLDHRSAMSGPRPPSGQPAAD